MKLMFDDTKALVLKKIDKEWRDVCVTEYRENGEWICGMNLITSLKDVLDFAEKEKKSILFECMFE